MEIETAGTWVLLRSDHPEEAMYFRGFSPGCANMPGRFDFEKNALLARLFPSQEAAARFLEAEPLVARHCKPVPLPDNAGMVVCDFCCETRFPLATMRCRTAERTYEETRARMEAQGYRFRPAQDPTNFTSVGDWAACDTCKAMIDAGQRNELAVYSFQCLLKKEKIDSPVMRAAALEMVRQNQNLYWDNRICPEQK